MSLNQVSETWYRLLSGGRSKEECQQHSQEPATVLGHVAFGGGKTGEDQEFGFQHVNFELPVRFKIETEGDDR